MPVSDSAGDRPRWQRGGSADDRLTDKLGQLSETVTALHDRFDPRKWIALDHLVVGPAGVYVIEVQRFRNAKVSVRRLRGLFRSPTEHLVVSGRTRTGIAKAMEWKVIAVSSALAQHPDLRGVPVVGILCFVDGRFSEDTSIEIGNVLIRSLNGTARVVTREGAIEQRTRSQLVEALALDFPEMPDD
ncbi:MAG: NERD domain-containing protein [Actinobacteria bacterium]|nr:NERD domain-containing protein [Actinomycetota bacterium]